MIKKVQRELNMGKIFLIRSLYLKHINNSCNSTIKRQANQKLFKESEQTFLQGKYTSTIKSSTPFYIRKMSGLTTMT
jgi:hypothetical protein